MPPKKSSNTANKENSIPSSTQPVHPSLISKKKGTARIQKPKAPPKPPKQAKWSGEDDATLIQVLIEQQAAGNQSDNGWKSCVWQAAMEQLAGSELVSGGAPKTAKRCHGRWDKVRDTLLLLFALY